MHWPIRISLSHDKQFYGQGDRRLVNVHNGAFGLVFLYCLTGQVFQGPWVGSGGFLQIVVSRAFLSALLT